VTSYSTSSHSIQSPYEALVHFVPLIYRYLLYGLPSGSCDRLFVVTEVELGSLVSLLYSAGTGEYIIFGFAITVSVNV
jgi:hypothetical protein